MGKSIDSGPRRAGYIARPFWPGFCFAPLLAAAKHSDWHGRAHLLICPSAIQKSLALVPVSLEATHGRHGRRPTMTVDHQAQLRVHIRWMIRRDMAEVLEIERSAFEFPWFEEEFIRCLRQRNCIGMVAEHG